MFSLYASVQSTDAMCGKAQNVIGAPIDQGTSIK